MGTQDVLVYVIVACCVVYMFRHYLKILFRRKGKSPGCGCGCDECPHARHGDEGGGDKKEKPGCGCGQ